MRVLTFLLIATSLGIRVAIAAEPTALASGSGFVIGKAGEIVTNYHVVRECSELRVTNSERNSQLAKVLAHDQTNDLALLRTLTATAEPGALRTGSSIRPGDTAVALGYPLVGLLASRANVAVGSVSALAGLRDDARYLQMSAPVQPGNSGGPLLDASGHIVGVVTAKLDAIRVAQVTGDIPENVNFAIKAEVLRIFLDANKVKYETGEATEALSPADVGERGTLFTVLVECLGPAKTTAAKPAPQTTAVARVPPAPKSVPKADEPAPRTAGLPTPPKPGTILRYDLSQQTNSETRRNTTQTLTVQNQVGSTITALIENGYGDRVVATYQTSTLFLTDEEFLAGPQAKTLIRIRRTNQFSPDSLFPLHAGQRALLRTEVERTLRTGSMASGVWTRECVVSGGERLTVSAVVYEGLQVRCNGQLTLGAGGTQKTYLYETDLLYAPDHDLVIRSANKFTDQSTGMVERTEAKLFSVSAGVEPPPMAGDPEERIHCFFKPGEPMLILPRRTCNQMSGHE